MAGTKDTTSSSSSSTPTEPQEASIQILEGNERERKRIRLDTGFSLDNPDNGANLDKFDSVCDIRNTLQKLSVQLASLSSSVVHKSSGTQTAASEQLKLPSDTPIWGKLVPANSGAENCFLRGGCFAIGKHQSCNLVLDSSFPDLVCQLHYVNGEVYLECLVNDVVQVNKRKLRSANGLHIHNGDEISFHGKSNAQSFMYISCLQLNMGKALPASAASAKKSPNQKSEKSGRSLLASSGTYDKQPLSMSLSRALNTLKRAKNISTQNLRRMSGAGADASDVAAIAIGSPLACSNTAPSSPQPDAKLADDSSKSAADASSSSDDIVMAEPADKAVEVSAPRTSFKEQEKARSDKIKNTFLTQFKEQVKTPANIKETFENFSYYLSPVTRDELMTAVYIFLKKPNFVKHTKHLSQVAPRVLLSGPRGTASYQERLIHALAKHLNVPCLIVDPASCIGKLEDEPEPEQESSPKTKDKSKAHRSMRHLDTAAYVSVPVVIKAPDSHPIFRGNFGGSHKSHRIPALKSGERVRFIGATSLNGSLGPKQRATPGPPHGATGEVVITFDRHARKVGVQFDDEFEGGLDLQTLMSSSAGTNEPSKKNGFFCDISSLKLIKQAKKSSTVLALEALLEFCNSYTEPLIVFLPRVEELVLGSSDRYKVNGLFKKQLKRLPETVVIIAGSVELEPADTIRPSPSTPGAGTMPRIPGIAFAKAADTKAVLETFFEQIVRADDRPKDIPSSLKVLRKTFPLTVSVSPPLHDNALMGVWTKQIDADIENERLQTNLVSIKNVLAKNNIVCNEPLTNPLLCKKILSDAEVEAFVSSALCHHLINTGSTAPTEGSSALELSSSALMYSIRKYKQKEKEARAKGTAHIETDNEFEKRLLPDVIPFNELSVKFQDIGALENTKQTLKELVMLPLQRPELFRSGNLTKPCKGILLFGPPGTGKTMLAKAVATESGASFINVSMSSIGSKWFGESEKVARAVFSLASKLAPTVVFIDEVDSILGKRGRSEHEAMRKIKNEFMSQWDGLKSRDQERIIVLGATNRPFDLDDAVLRRFPRRIMVDLPDANNREKILGVILKDQKLVPDFDFKSLAASTEGYSGSDLKNLCIAAAYIPIREYLKSETNPLSLGTETKVEASQSEDKEKGGSKRQREENETKEEESKATKRLKTSSEPASSSTPSSPSPTTANEGEDADATKVITSTATKSLCLDIEEESSDPIALRPLSLADFNKAKSEVSVSVNEDAYSISELRKWNEMYGEGGSRNKNPLTYFM